MSAAALGEAKQQLDKAAYDLMLEECEYDAKCLTAYRANIASYELRLQHQKDTWTKQRVDRAKEASNIAWDSKVLWLGNQNILLHAFCDQAKCEHVWTHIDKMACLPALDRCEHIAGRPDLMGAPRWPCWRTLRMLQRSGYQGWNFDLGYLRPSSMFHVGICWFDLCSMFTLHFNKHFSVVIAKNLGLPGHLQLHCTTALQEWCGPLQFQAHGPNGWGITARSAIFGAFAVTWVLISEEQRCIFVLNGVCSSDSIVQLWLSMRQCLPATVWCEVSNRSFTYTREQS